MEDVTIEKIAELKKEIEKYIGQLGEKKVKRILYDHFALSDEDIREFIRIFEDMIPGVPFDILPEKWLFEDYKPSSKKTKGPIKKGPKTKKHGTGPKHEPETLIDRSPIIQEEYPQIKHWLEHFWELPDDLKEIVKYRWPPKYRKYLMKEEVEVGNEIYTHYSPRNATCFILADRHESTPSTIETYLKKPRKAKKVQ